MITDLLAFRWPGPHRGNNLLDSEKQGLRQAMSMHGCTDDLTP
ncbi:hypothetical protein [Streptomyces sp. NPDC048357]